MNLKLKFIGVDDNDVIATSGALCAYTGTKDKFKYISIGSMGYYYLFVDVDNKYNTQDGTDQGWSEYPYMGADFRPDYDITSIMDTNGHVIEDTRPTNGNYYHFDNDILYLCKDPNHTFGSFDK